MTNPVMHERVIPNELLVMIGERGDTKANLMNLRLASRACSDGAGRLLFQSLTKTITPQGLSDLVAISQSQAVAATVRYVALKAPKLIDDEWASSFINFRLTPSAIGMLLMGFMNLEEIACLFHPDLAFGLRCGHVAAIHVMRDIFEPLVAASTRLRRLHVATESHGVLSQLASIWSDGGAYQQRFHDFMRQFIDIKLCWNNTTINLSRENLYADGPRIVADPISLNLTTDVGWLVLSGNTSLLRVGWQMTRLQRLCLTGVACTAYDLICFLDGSRDTLRQVQFKDIGLCLSLVAPSILETPTPPETWEMVFDFLKQCDQLQSFEYTTLATFHAFHGYAASRWSSRNLVDNTWGHLNVKELHWASDDDRRALGHLLILLKKRCKNLKVPFQLDDIDLKHYLMAKRERPARLAAIKARKAIQDLMDGPNDVVNDYGDDNVDSDDDDDDAGEIMMNGANDLYNNDIM